MRKCRRSVGCPGPKNKAGWMLISALSRLFFAKERKQKCKGKNSRETKIICEAKNQTFHVCWYFYFSKSIWIDSIESLKIDFYYKLVSLVTNYWYLIEKSIFIQLIDFFSTFSKIFALIFVLQCSVLQVLFIPDFSIFSKSTSDKIDRKIDLLCTI